MMRKQFMKDCSSLSPGQSVSMSFTVESLFSSLINLSFLFFCLPFCLSLLPSFLFPLLTSLPPPPPHPGGSDGWYHHGDGSGPAWTTLLPAGCLRELPSSGRRQGVLRLRSACRGDLVGTKGKTQRGVNMWAVPGPLWAVPGPLFYKQISFFPVLLLKLLSSLNE